MERVVAAGSANYGFWFDVPPAPRGASSHCTLGDTICPTEASMCPQGATIREFADNVAHSAFVGLFYAQRAVGSEEIEPE